MKNFKTKFNYLAFGLRVLLFLIFVGLFCLIIIKGIPSLYYNHKIGWVKFAIGIVGMLFVLVFLSFRIGRLVLKEHSNIVIDSGNLILKHDVQSKQRLISKEELIGFSTTVYQTKAWDFKSIIFYFSNGDKMEFPQFLYWNFKEIQQALIDNDVKYFGYEPYRWKWVDTRYYLYD